MADETDLVPWQVTSLCREFLARGGPSRNDAFCKPDDVNLSQPLAAIQEAIQAPDAETAAPLLRHCSAQILGWTLLQWVSEQPWRLLGHITPLQLRVQPGDRLRVALEEGHADHAPVLHVLVEFLVDVTSPEAGSVFSAQLLSVQWAPVLFSVETATHSGHLALAATFLEKMLAQRQQQRLQAILDQQEAEIAAMTSSRTMDSIDAEIVRLENANRSSASSVSPLESGGYSQAIRSAATPTSPRKKDRWRRGVPGSKRRKARDERVQGKDLERQVLTREEQLGTNYEPSTSDGEYRYVALEDEGPTPPSMWDRLTLACGCRSRQRNGQCAIL